MSHISFLSSLHQKTTPLLQLHKRYTKLMLQWPSPFQITDARQEHVRKQQIIQNTPDRLVEILLQIQHELQNLQLLLQQNISN